MDSDYLQHLEHHFRQQTLDISNPDDVQAALKRGREFQAYAIRTALRLAVARALRLFRRPARHRPAGLGVHSRISVPTR